MAGILAALFVISKGDFQMTVQTPLQLVITIGIIALGTFSDPCPSVFPVSRRKRNTARCYLPRRSAPQRFHRNARRYCFKNVSVFSGSHGLPELISCRVRHCRPQMEAQPAALHRRRHGFIHAAGAAASSFLKIVFSSAGVGLPFFRRFCLHPVQRHCYRVRL